MIRGNFPVAGLRALVYRAYRRQVVAAESSRVLKSRFYQGFQVQGVKQVSRVFRVWALMVLGLGGCDLGV